MGSLRLKKTAIMRSFLFVDKPLDTYIHILYNITMFEESDVPEMSADLEEQNFLKRCRAPIAPIMDGSETACRIAVRKLTGANALF